jgi:putative endonuclease
MAEHLERGRLAEALAAQHLCSQGLALVATNFRARVGELDLVMTEGRVLVVVEVRSRACRSFLSPAESVTRSKQQRIVRATQYFLLRHRQFARWPVRFDVVEVTGGLEQPVLNWIRAAFDCNDMAAG